MPWYFNIYTMGIGAGTLLGLALFIFAGRWLLLRLHTSQRAINIIVGIVFFISAVVQVYRLLYKPLNDQLHNKPALVISLQPVNNHVCSMPVNCRNILYFL